MINLSDLKDKEIRKILTYEVDGEIEEVVIKNPTLQFAEKFFEKEFEENNNYSTLEYLIKNLTNITMDASLKEVIEGGYASIVLQEVVEELTLILGEMYRKFMINANTLMEISDITQSVKINKKKNKKKK